MLSTWVGLVGSWAWEWLVDGCRIGGMAGLLLGCVWCSLYLVMLLWHGMVCGGWVGGCGVFASWYL